MKNVVYSTTRQWNPGDEFILMGVERLLSRQIGEHNSIIYNRSPHVRPNFPHYRSSCIKRFFLKILYNQAVNRGDFFDNSLSQKTAFLPIDLVVFAGSPEWSGEKTKDLYRLMLERGIRGLFLGIGSFGEFPLTSLTSDERQVLSNSLIVCRNLECAESLKKYQAVYLPCPALFSSAHVKQITKVKKIALLYGTSQAANGNNISTETELFMKQIYMELLSKYEDEYQFEFVAHYIEELESFEKDFPGYTIRYNYKSDAYLDIFSKFDLVIGHRVHGIGMCASLGIPGIMFAHDGRSTTVKGFLAEIIRVGESFNVFEEVFLKTINSISEKNAELIQHKSDTEQKYRSLLERIYP